MRKMGKDKVTIDEFIDNISGFVYEQNTVEQKTSIINSGIMALVGQLVLSSHRIEDLLEKLVNRNAGPKPTYKVYY